MSTDERGTSRRAVVTGLATAALCAANAPAKSAAITTAARPEDEALMREAIALAAQADFPFGAVITRDGAVLARGHNLGKRTHDPTAHGEMVAIRRFLAERGPEELKGTTLYTSGEPCPMCMGAIVWCGIKRVVYGASIAQLSAHIGQIMVTSAEVARGHRSGRSTSPAACSPMKQSTFQTPTLTAESAMSFAFARSLWSRWWRCSSRRRLWQYHGLSNQWRFRSRCAGDGHDPSGFHAQMAGYYRSAPCDLRLSGDHRLEAATAAILSWRPSARRSPAADHDRFLSAKPLGVLGLTFGLLLYGFGITIVGGEWFAMWQSKIWNGLHSAARFMLLDGLVLLVLLIPEGWMASAFARISTLDRERTWFAPTNAFISH